MTTGVGASVHMLVSLVVRPVINLIHQGTSLTFKNKSAYIPPSEGWRLARSDRFFDPLRQDFSRDIVQPFSEVIVQLRVYRGCRP